MAFDPASTAQREGYRQNVAFRRVPDAAIALQPVAVVQVAAKVAQRIALTAVAKVVQQAATVVETRNNVIMNG